jgi:hypothetical protein
MITRFEEGDRVRVVMADNKLFGQCVEEATLRHVPMDTGDCIHIVTDGGALVMINPMAGDFTGMEKLADGKDVTK